MNTTPVRKPDGKFVEGISGNPNGRAKNTVSKIVRTYNPQFKLEDLNFDPVDEMVKIFRSLDTDSYESTCVKVDICKHLLQYIAPKLRSVEYSGNINVSHEQALKALMVDVITDKEAAQTADIIELKSAT
ncbi:MAG: hypothetical protein EKK56_00810 [Flavobacteriaceae bacterium]|nr:MAG: hypothetical protein EKK56_00810 [Flavobacteriaceae bacterium]